MTSWLLSRLDRDTRAHHAIADTDRFAALDDATRAGYRRFLATIYHFEYALESQLVAVTELPIRFIATRLRSGALADDLCALGADASVLHVLARPLTIPHLAGAAEALGWIYAVQRNTFRHADLVRALAPRLRGTLGMASRYLTAYAPTVYQRWQELGVQLDRIGASAEAAHRVASAAHEAFARQHEWYARGPSWLPHGESALRSVGSSFAMR